MRSEKDEKKEKVFAFKNVDNVLNSWYQMHSFRLFGHETIYVFESTNL